MGGGGNKTGFGFLKSLFLDYLTGVDNSKPFLAQEFVLRIVQLVRCASFQSF